MLAAELDAPREADARPSVRGSVRASDGERLAGATLRLTRREGAFDREVSTARADDEGAFELGGLEPGSYQLWCTLEGYATEVAPLALGAGEHLERELVLRPEGVLFGEVRDRSGYLVDDARLLARRFETGALVLEAPLIHDEAGRFEVHGLPPGDYWLTALAPERAPDTLALPVRIGGDGATQARFRVGVGGTLRIRVHGVGGAPRAGVRLELDRIVDGRPVPVAEDEPWQRELLVRATTDDSGAATLYRVEPGDWRVRVVGTAEPTARDVQVREGKRVEIEIELTR